MNAGLPGLEGLNEVRWPPTKQCVHYEARSREARVLGRVEFITLTAGVDVERVRVILCDACVEAMIHWLGYRT